MAVRQYHILGRILWEYSFTYFTQALYMAGTSIQVPEMVIPKNSNHKPPTDMDCSYFKAPGYPLVISQFAMKAMTHSMGYLLKLVILPVHKLLYYQRVNQACSQLYYNYPIISHRKSKIIPIQDQSWIKIFTAMLDANMLCLFPQPSQFIVIQKNKQSIPLNY